jgi:hypothetical protein
MFTIFLSIPFHIHMEDKTSPLPYHPVLHIGCRTYQEETGVDPLINMDLSCQSIKH